MEIVFIVGNLGTNPETRMTQSGQKVVSFSVASNKKKNGKDETTWWKVVIFGDRFDKMLSYLKKGSAVIVTGEMDVSIWKDKSGENKLQHTVIADSIKFGPSTAEKKEQREDMPLPYQINQPPF